MGELSLALEFLSKLHYFKLCWASCRSPWSFWTNFVCLAENIDSGQTSFALQKISILDKLRLSCRKYRFWTNFVCLAENIDSA